MGDRQGDFGPLWIHEVVGDDNAATMQRRRGKRQIVTQIVVAVAAIDAEKPYRSDAAADLGRAERGGETDKDLAVVERNAEKRTVLVKARAATQSCRVLVDRVVLEDIDGERLLAGLARPRQQEERAAVMHADLRHGARDARV